MYLINLTAFELGMLYGLVREWERDKVPADFKNMSEQLKTIFDAVASENKKKIAVDMQRFWKLEVHRLNIGSAPGVN